MDQWLVRTTRNVILGPMSKEELRKRIQANELGPEDEVCSGNGYWVFLYEYDEVKRWLDVEVPRRERLETDVTKTDTEFDFDRTDPEIGNSLDDSVSQQTSMIDTGRHRRMRPASFASEENGQTEDEASTQFGRLVERPLVLRVFTWLLFFGVFYLVYMVLRLTRSP